jgi:5'-deoxynucleotidase
MFALFHDSPETRYGDIPTPGKDMIRRLSTPTIFKDMDEQLLPSVPFIDETPSLEVARIVEIADLLEAAAWIRENGVGEHARVVAGKMHHRLVGRVEDACKETGQDWYGPVNEVLMALGAPIIHHNSWIHKL